MGEDGYDYLGLGGGSCMDTAKATRAIVANGGEVLDYVAPTDRGQEPHRIGAAADPVADDRGDGPKSRPWRSSRYPKKGN